MKDINQKYTDERILSSKESEKKGVEAQTESGELVITPDGDIANVAAKKKHSEMEEDEVTDILEEGSYVLSHAEDGSMNITREEAEAEVFGMGVSVYKENGTSVPAKEKTLADFFPKGVDEMTPADLGRRIRAAYPMSQQDDVYAKKSNSMNKQNRESAVLALVKLNEKKRIDKEGPDEVIEETNLDVPEFLPGGAVTNYLSNVLIGDPPSKYQGGDMYGGVSLADIERMRREAANPDPLFFVGPEDATAYNPGNFADYQTGNGAMTERDAMNYYANRTSNLYDPSFFVGPEDATAYNPGNFADYRLSTEQDALDYYTNQVGNLAGRKGLIQLKDSPATTTAQASSTPSVDGSQQVKVDDDVATQSGGLYSGLTDLEAQFKKEQDKLDAQLEKVRKDYTDFMKTSTENARARSQNSLKQYLEEVDHANRVFDRQSLAGFMGNIAINAAQDPTVDAVDYSDQINAVKSELDRTPEYLKEYQSKGLAAQARNNAKSMFDNTSQFNRAASNMSAINASSMNALSDIAVGNNQKEIQQFNSKAERIGGMRTQQDLADVNKFNAERANVNTKISAYGNSLENYLGELKMGDMTKNNAEMQARMAMDKADSEYQTRLEYLQLRETSDKIRDLYNQKAMNREWLARFENRMNPFAPKLQDAAKVTPGEANGTYAQTIMNSEGNAIFANAGLGGTSYGKDPSKTISTRTPQEFQDYLSEVGSNFQPGGVFDPEGSLFDETKYNNNLTFSNKFLGNQNKPGQFEYVDLFK